MSERAAVTVNLAARNDELGSFVALKRRADRIEAALDEIVDLCEQGASVDAVGRVAREARTGADA